MELNLCKLITKIGDDGKYQKSIVLLIFLLWCTCDFLSISIPYLEVNRKISILEPKDNTTIIKTLDYSICKNVQNFKEKTTEISGHSWTIEFDIECSEKYVGMIGSFIFIGVFIGSFLFQILPDYIGRKRTIQISCFFYAFSLFSFTYFKSFFLIFSNLIFNQIFASLAGMTGFMYVLEICSKEKRSSYGAFINSGFSVSGMFYIFIYKQLNNWRYSFYIATAINLFTWYLLYVFLVESPRFYLVQNNLKELYLSLYKIAEVNGEQQNFKEYLESPENEEFKMLKPSLFIDNENINIEMGNENYNNNNDNKNKISYNKDDNNIDYKTIQDNYNGICNNNCNTKEKENIITENNQDLNQDLDINTDDLIKNKDKQTLASASSSSLSSASFFDLFTNKKICLTFLITCYLWLSTSGIYYGLSINIKNLPGDIYTNGLLIYFAEIFSYIVSGWIIETWLGRKYSLILFETISFFGYCFLIISGLRNYWLTIISFVARFAISAVYNIIYTYSVEIYPTSLRAKGFGFNSICARIGGIIFPLVIEFFAEYVSFFFMSLNFIALVLIILLPETKGKILQENLENENENDEEKNELKKEIIKIYNENMEEKIKNTQKI
jgi:MFS family permease